MIKYYLVSKWSRPDASTFMNHFRHLTKMLIWIQQACGLALDPSFLTSSQVVPMLLII